MSLLDEVKARPMPELAPPETLVTDADVGSRAYTARQVRDHIRTARESVAAEADARMARLCEALERLMRHYPTDGEMRDLGMSPEDIAVACDDYDFACAALSEARKA